MPTSYEIIWCDRAVGNRIYIPAEAGGYSIATSGTDDGVHFNPVAPFEVVSSDSSGDTCTCVAQARRCSDDVLVAIYVNDSDVDFTKTYLVGSGLFGGGVCVYFDPDDERILGCACVTGGTPYPFTEFDGDCEDCTNDNTDPDFYVHGFTCGDNPKPIDVWVLESDVTLNTQVYFHADYGCIVFKGPPSLDHGTLIDAGELTTQTNCTSCQSTHAYVRGYRCGSDIATSIFVPEGSVVTDGTKVYKAGTGCVYFTPLTYSPSPVPPTNPAGWAQFDSCDDCLGYVQAHLCGTGELLDAWTDASLVVVAPLATVGKVYQITFDGELVCVYYTRPIVHAIGGTRVDPEAEFDDCDSCNDNSIVIFFDYHGGGTCSTAPPPENVIFADGPPYSGTDSAGNAYSIVDLGSQWALSNSFGVFWTMPKSGPKPDDGAWTLTSDPCGTSPSATNV